MRTESRGGHYREDFPERDDTKFLRAITIKRVQDEMELDWIERDSEWKDRAKDLDGLWWG